MRPAAWPRPPEEERLLVVDPANGRFETTRFAALERHLAPGDLLVVNDAATLPASLTGVTAKGAPIEARIFGQRDDGTWRALLFGEGTFRTRTEDRPPPPAVAPGDRLAFGPLAATVVDVDHPRLVRLRFDAEGDALWSALFAVGKPVQYAHIRAPLALYDVQTPYAARPWASELCSAGRPLTSAQLAAMRARGIGVAVVTHAAGLSSTGDAALDARLPLPEAYEIPRATEAAIARAKGAGGRVVAIGTSVARALEGCAAAHDGALVASAGETALRIGPEHRLRIVDGIVTGMHEREASHFALLRAFASRALLDRAWSHAEAAGFLGHEFGDAALVLPGALAATNEGRRHPGVVSVSA